MAKARVWGGFFYAQTRPASPHSLPEPGLFNRQVFFFFFYSKPAPLGPIGLSNHIWALSKAVA